MKKAYLITLSEKELEELITTCVQKAVRELFSTFPLPNQKPQMGGVELAVQVTGLAKSTIYALVSKRQIPHKKRGNRLYFMEAELTDWIKQHHRKTVQELQQEATHYFTHQRSKHSRKTG